MSPLPDTEPILTEENGEEVISISQNTQPGSTRDLEDFREIESQGRILSEDDDDDMVQPSTRRPQSIEKSTAEGPLEPVPEVPPNPLVKRPQNKAKSSVTLRVNSSDPGAPPREIPLLADRPSRSARSGTIVASPIHRHPQFTEDPIDDDEDEWTDTDEPHTTYPTSSRLRERLGNGSMTRGNPSAPNTNANSERRAVLQRDDDLHITSTHVRDDEAQEMRNSGYDYGRGDSYYRNNRETGQAVPYYPNPFTPSPYPTAQPLDRPTYGQNFQGTAPYSSYYQPPQADYLGRQPPAYSPWVPQIGWQPPPPTEIPPQVPIAANPTTAPLATDHELARMRKELEKMARKLNDTNKELEEHRIAETRHHTLGRAQRHEQRKNEERVEEDKRRAETKLLEERAKKAEREAEVKIKAQIELMEESKRVEEERQKRLYRDIREQLEAEFLLEQQRKKAEEDARRRIKEDIREELLVERRDHDEFILREESRKKEIERRVEREYEEKRRREEEMLQYKERTERRLRMEADKVIEQERRKYDIERLGFEVRRDQEKVIQETIMKAAIMSAGSTTPRLKEPTPQVNDYLAGTPSAIPTELFQNMPSGWALFGNGQPRSRHEHSTMRVQDDRRYSEAWDRMSSKSPPIDSNLHDNRRTSMIGVPSGDWHQGSDILAGIQQHPFAPRNGMSNAPMMFPHWGFPQTSVPIQAPIPTAHYNQAQVLRGFPADEARSDATSSNLIFTPALYEIHTDVGTVGTEAQILSSRTKTARETRSTSSANRVQTSQGSRTSSRHTPTYLPTSQPTGPTANYLCVTAQNVSQPRATSQQGDIQLNSRRLVDRHQIAAVQNPVIELATRPDRPQPRSTEETNKEAEKSLEHKTPMLDGRTLVSRPRNDVGGYGTAPTFHHAMPQTETPPIHIGTPTEVREQQKHDRAWAKIAPYSGSWDQLRIGASGNSPALGTHSQLRPNGNQTQSEGSVSPHLKRRKAFMMEHRNKLD